MSDLLVTREAETVRRRRILVAEIPVAHLAFLHQFTPNPIFSLSDALNTPVSE